MTNNWASPGPTHEGSYPREREDLDILDSPLPTTTAAAARRI